jgi:HPt (histidine-containing phosphotransfer) domain-containing protein/PAS domain-containing protein
MIARSVCLIFFLTILFGSSPVVAGEDPPGCDSCKIQIDSLNQPHKLNGKWLFTRDDSPQNKDIRLDTSAWRLARAPGPWKGVYDDNKVFPVGWYRGYFEFNPAMIGQEVVLLVNAYMGRVNVYIDGKEVYRRPSNINVERYYSTQAIPVRFTITQPHQVLALRVDTPLMTGVYQLPFELRKYDARDVALVAYQILGGEARLIASYVILFFGFFFLLVYAKTRYSLYFVCAITSILIFPFFAAPGDYFLSIFSPETMLYLHYPGMFAQFLCYIFAQHYYKFTPKINWIAGSLLAAMGLTIGSMAWHPNLELFQHVRSAYFISLMASGFGACYMLARGVQHKKPGAGVLLVGMTVFLAAGLNDVFLALGLITSYALIFFGGTTAIASMLYVASNTFANTFLENKKLVKDLQVMNDSLEDLVVERTAQLRQKTNDMQTMLENMPQGVLTVLADNTIHPEYSAYLETIFGTNEIAGKNLMELVFANTNLGSDMLSQIEAATAACIGEDRMNFEFNAHLLATEFDKKMADGRSKSLELIWSPICTESGTIEKIMLCVRDVTELKRLASEASAQKRELEIIGEILAVSQEKFQEFIDNSNRFAGENAAAINQTSQKDDQVINRLFRNMHTIKGNARTYGLLHMTNVVHETEQGYDELRKNPDKAWEPGALLEQLDQVRAVVDEYARISGATLGRKGPGRRAGVERFLMVEKEQIVQSLHLVDSTNPDDNAALRATLAQIGMTLSSMGTEKIGVILDGVVESMPTLAKAVGKEPPRITIDDHGIAIRHQISGMLKNLFMHLFSNSVGHGIETAETRRATGKPAAGHIQLTLALEGDRLRLTMRDDGRGLAIARIRQHAIERKLLTDGEMISPERLAQMIFITGFSTAEKVTELSGRGVGMDAVKEFLKVDGGEVDIRFLDNNDSADFRPFELVISLPGKFAAQVES